MRSEIARRRARLLVTFAVLAVGVLVSACADKGLVHPTAAFNPKMTLQLVTTASQTIGFGPKWLLVIAASATPKDTIPIAYKFFPFAGGSQQITLPVDISSCIAANASAGKDGCTMLVAAALMIDTLARRDSTGDLFSRAFDFAIVGPFEVGPGRTPTIPPIDLSASRFGVVYWEGDEALRLAGAGAPVQTTGNTITGATSGTSTQTLFTITSGTQQSGSNAPNFNPIAYPQLAIFQNGSWSRVTATVAPPLGPGNSGFTDVFALSANEVYMSSYGGLYKYDGAAVTRVSGVQDSLASVAGVIAGQSKYVIAGGLNGTVWIGNPTSFQRYTLPNTPRVDGVCITGPNEAFAASSTGGGLFRFDGTAWTSVPASTNVGKIDLQCPSPGQAYVTAIGQSFLRWTGSGWTNVSGTGLPAATVRGTRMAVVSPTEIYAYGDSSGIDRAFYRFDGSSWREVGRSRVTQIGGRPWAVPGGGAAYVMSSFARIERMSSAGSSVISYQPSLRDVAVNSSTSAFAVGWNLFLARWDGTRWNIDTPPISLGFRLLEGVWSDGPKNAWAVGVANTILRYDGNGWSVVSDGPRPVATPDNYNGVWGTGNDVWAVGDATILHCKSPTSCVNESTGGSGSLYTAWGTSASNIFAVGDNGRIVRYNGTSWTPMQSPTNRTLVRVTGSGPSDVWAVGDSVLVHFDGTTWSDVSTANSDLRYALSRVPTRLEQSQNPYARGIFNLGLWARGPKEVYLATQFGGIYRYDGNRWREMTNSNGLGGHRILSLSGASSGCALYVTESQTDAPQPTLGRGVGSTGCFSTPMSGPTVWP
jgi:hypothetical protein